MNLSSRRFSKNLLIRAFITHFPMCVSSVRHIPRDSFIYKIFFLLLRVSFFPSFDVASIWHVCVNKSETALLGFTMHTQLEKKKKKKKKKKKGHGKGSLGEDRDLLKIAFAARKPRVGFSN